MRERLKRVLGKKRLRGIALNLALLLASFTFAGLLAELAVRLVAPQQLIQMRSDIWQPADSVGWMHRPDASATINTGERTVSVFTDSEGFRVGASGRTEGGAPVLVLGDSFMNALQVEYEQSFPNLLEKGLAASLEESVAVRNAGIDGWTPSQYLIRSRMLLPHDDYRLVVVALYVANDAQRERVEYYPPRPHAVRYDFRLPGDLSAREFVDSFLRPLNDALEVRSHAFTLVKNRLQTLRMRLGLYPLDFPSEFMRSEAEAERWATTAEISLSLQRAAAEVGAETLFVFIPAAFQVDEGEFERYTRGYGVDPSTVDLDQPNRLLAEEMQARGLTVVDVLPAFRSAHESGVSLYGRVDAHLTPEGHQLLTQLVLPTAVELMTAEEPAEALPPAR